MFNTYRIKTKEDQKKAVTLENKLNWLIKFDNRCISSLSFPISIEQCKFMDSKMRPLYLVFENLDELGDFVRIIFKNGDGKTK